MFCLLWKAQESPSGRPEWAKLERKPREPLPKVRGRRCSPLSPHLPCHSPQSLPPSAVRPGPSPRGSAQMPLTPSTWSQPPGFPQAPTPPREDQGDRALPGPTPARVKAGSSMRPPSWRHLLGAGMAAATHGPGAQQGPAACGGGTPPRLGLARGSSGRAPSFCPSCSRRCPHSHPAIDQVC